MINAAEDYFEVRSNDNAPRGRQISSDVETNRGLLTGRTTTSPDAPEKKTKTRVCRGYWIRPDVERTGLDSQTVAQHLLFWLVEIFPKG